ncbi:hypothetical protein GLYMA_19G183300v4 [Glycine max]|nr:hypothetical protein GLYMA_19G183300v4 [Glycine max]KAG4396434.1 hypothetical protein GLYMA_19G183300v4 [Glycine max]KAG4913413.1 hypothetical protein JHK86_053846 [Glycine max]KAH1078468.1 hypothetical protein GYH30_053466 [Glycine max]KAH1078469.1 hypothetical protein GYH30_053466 [Glycine max]
MVLDVSGTFVGSQHRNGTPQSVEGISQRMGVRVLCRCFFLELGASKASRFSSTGWFVSDFSDGVLTGRGWMRGSRKLRLSLEQIAEEEGNGGEKSHCRSSPPMTV